MPMAMERRLFLTLLPLALAAGGAAWWLRDWLPTRGLTNPCLATPLPESLAKHPVVIDALDGIDLSRAWDGHVHLLGTGNSAGSDIWINPVMESAWHPVQYLQKRFYLNASCVEDGEGGDVAFVDRLIELSAPLADSRLMLLAFDYNHDEQGQRHPERSTFYVANRYAEAVAARHPRLEWICSVHPYREDAVEALRWCAAHGARAVKWLPPAMGMDPSSPRCDPFYAAMQALDLPLLSHGGDELAVQGGGHQEYGNPLLLRRALEHGVRVIVAHCASEGTGRDLRRGPSGPVVRNFDLWLSMMRDPAYADLLYGDLSAVTQLNRAPEALQTLLLADDLHDRLLNGSDYPLPGVVPLFSPGQHVRLGLVDEVTASVVFELQPHNPLLFDLVLKRSLRWQGRRFPPRVFETAGFFAGLGGLSPRSPGPCPDLLADDGVSLILGLRVIPRSHQQRSG
jgi:mannonate dehydratase